jgi:PrpF protein
VLNAQWTEPIYPCLLSRFRINISGLAEQRYAKSHRIFANSLGVKDFRRFRNSQDGTWFRHPFGGVIGGSGQAIRIGMPSGILAVGAAVEQTGPNGWIAQRGSYFRTTRRLFAGRLYL